MKTRLLTRGELFVKQYPGCIKMNSMTPDICPISIDNSVKCPKSEGMYTCIKCKMHYWHNPADINIRDASQEPLDMTEVALSYEKTAIKLQLELSSLKMKYNRLVVDIESLVRDSKGGLL
jgi:hypothetical protein